MELTLVDNLSLLDLAPGGHLGRFIIWTKGAFEKLDSLFGTYDESAKFKSGFNLPRSMMTNADLARIMYVLLLRYVITTTQFSICATFTCTAANKAVDSEYNFSSFSLDNI